MKNYSKITPVGTKDLLFEECLANRTVSSILGNVFSQRGFHEVLTPGIEFYDLFKEEVSGIPMEYMFKMSDSKGRLMVVRPDSTLPIARMVTTRLMNERHPIRLYYNQRVYRYNPGLTGRSNEVMQTGIELIGASGKRADLETITTAVEALSKNLPVSDDEREQIRQFIESKNYSALNSELDKLEQTQAVGIIRRLPRLFGGVEVLDEAITMCEDEAALSSLEYVRELYNDLTKLGLGDRIMIDLGLVQRNDYYSDIVFSGYVMGSGEPVLIGGRYDRLLDNFDRPAAAIGFGINVDALAAVMMKRGNVPEKKRPDILVHSEKGYEIEAIRYTGTLFEAGITGENSVFETPDEALEYARNTGIKKLTIVGEEIKTIDTGVES